VGTDVIFGIAAGVLGLCLGSFLNVCILRLPHDQSLVTPPSTCPRCGKRIAWFDNIPVVSWLVLRGKCRNCGEPISLQYPLIEAAVGALWVGAYLLWGVSVHTIAGGILGTILLGIGITDARHYLIPDEYNWAGLAVGLAASLVGGWQGFVQAVIGAAFGFSLLFAVGVAGRWMFGEEAMGGGDIKMMAMVGSFVGPKDGAGWWHGVLGVLLTVFAGALFGTIIFVPLSLRKKRLVPFGVFLAVGAAVTYIWGDLIFDWYRRFVSGG
jgi:leader peptidase (prepilin peptidase)/N-methyltransferase